MNKPLKPMPKFAFETEDRAFCEQLSYKKYF